MTRTKRIYLLRHGAIEGVARKTYIGQIDPPLSREGIAQAEAWRRYFREAIPAPPERIVCSDLRRCAVFAKIIAGADPERICVEPAFREIALGAWEGITMSEIREKFPDAWAARGENLVDFRPPGGESFGDLAERVLPAFACLCETAPPLSVLVAHAGVNRVILADILGVGLNDVFQIPQNYGDGTMIEIVSNGEMAATPVPPPFA